MRDIKVLGVVCIGLGALLGYAAGSGRINQWPQAQAGPLASNAAQQMPAGATDPAVATRRWEDGCCIGLGMNKGVAALAAHNQH